MRFALARLALALLAATLAEATLPSAVRTWGPSKEGELGRPGLGFAYPGVVDVSGLLSAEGDRVKRVSAGVYFSYAISDAGEVLAWGDNAAGQLVRLPTSPLYLPGSMDADLELEDGDKLIQAEASLDNGLLLSASGRLWSTGRRASCPSCSEVSCVGSWLEEVCSVGDTNDIAGTGDCDATCYGSVLHASEFMGFPQESDGSLLLEYVSGYQALCNLTGVDHNADRLCDQSPVEFTNETAGFHVVAVSAGIESDLFLSDAGDVYERRHELLSTEVSVSSILAEELGCVECDVLCAPSGNCTDYEASDDADLVCACAQEYAECAAEQCTATELSFFELEYALLSCPDVESSCCVAEALALTACAENATVSCCPELQAAQACAVSSDECSVDEAAIWTTTCEENCGNCTAVDSGDACTDICADEYAAAANGCDDVAVFAQCTIDRCSAEDATQWVTTCGEWCGDEACPDLAEETDQWSLVALSLEPGEAVAELHSSQYQHSHMVLTTRGRVLSWGDAMLGRANASSPDLEVDFGGQLGLGERVTSLSVGSLAVAAATNQGRLFTWGSTSACLLGRAATDDELPAEAAADGDWRVVDVGAGHKLMTAVTADGRVLSWGDSDMTARVDDADASVSVVLKLQELDDGLNAASVECGAGYAMVLSRAGALFSWGLASSETYGEVRSIDAVGRARSMALPGDVEMDLEDGEYVVDVAAEYFGAMFAVTSTGRALSWGLGSNGVLGRGGDFSVPTELTDLSQVVAATAGVDVCFFTDASDRVWAVGLWNLDLEPVLVASLLPGSQQLVASFKVGFGGSWMFVQHNGVDLLSTLILLGTPYVVIETAMTVPEGLGVADISVGLYQTLLLTTDGRVFVADSAEDDAADWGFVEVELDLDQDAGEVVIDVEAAAFLTATTSTGRALTWGSAEHSPEDAFRALGRDGDTLVPAAVAFEPDAGDQIVWAMCRHESGIATTSQGRVVTWGTTLEDVLGRDTSGEGFVAWPAYADDVLLNEGDEVVPLADLGLSRGTGLVLVSSAPQATKVAPAGAPTDLHEFDGSVVVYGDVLARKQGEAVYCRWVSEGTGLTEEVLGELGADGASVNCSVPYVGAEGDVEVSLRFDSLAQPRLDSASLYSDSAVATFSYDGCAAGADQSLSTVCQACVVGSYREPGAEACEACPARMDTGGAVGSTSADACVCVEGFSTTSSGDCECAAGRVLLNGDEVCDACPASTFSAEADSASCAACPENSDSVEGSSECLCLAGFFGSESAESGELECHECAEGLLCDVNGLTFGTVDSDEGYWQDRAFFEDDPGSLFVHACYDGDVCRGMDNCTEGYTGPLCGSCEAGFVRSGGECVVCSSTEALSTGTLVTLLLALLVAIVAGAYALVRCRKAVIAAKEAVMAFVVDEALDVEFTDDPEANVDTGGIKTKIIVGFFQVLSQFSVVLPAVAWPAAFTDMTSRLSALNLELAELPGVGCVFESTHYDRLLFATVLPAALLAGLALAAVGYRHLRARGWLAGGDASEEEEGAAELRRKCALLGPSEVVTAADVQRICKLEPDDREGAFKIMFATGLECDSGELDGEDVQAWCHGAAADDERSEQRRRAEFAAQTVTGACWKIGFFVLFLFYPGVSTLVLQTFRCEDLEDGSSWLVADLSLECDGDRYARWSAFAGAMVVVYPVGVPLFFFLVLWRQRHRLFLSAGLRTPDGLPCEPNPRMASQLGFLYTAYEPQFFWWESLELARKLLITSVIIFISPGTATQIVAAILISLAAMVLYAHRAPYVEDSDDTLMLIAQLQTLLTLIGGLLLFLDVQESPDDGVDSDVFGAILVFTNVAPIAMFLAVLAYENLMSALDTLAALKETLGLEEDASALETWRAMRARARARGQVATKEVEMTAF